MTIAQSASEAFDLYTAALHSDLLVQSSWHREIDGRQLACGLGVLGSVLDDPTKCPAQIMPRWLAQMVPWFFDNQDFDAAKNWGLRFYAELKRIDGKVPFSVVHDWQANFVCALGVSAAKKRMRDPAVHKALAEMHSKALAGEKLSKEEWKAKINAAYADVCANPYVNAGIYANAYAYADADAYADAYIYTYTYADAIADANAKRQEAVKILADGMVACLGRVPAS